MFTFLKPVVVAMIGVLAVAVSPASAEEPGGESSKQERTCFRVRDVRGASAIDDRFVYIKAVRDQHYLLTMVNSCLGLENSIGVTISNKFDRVCSHDKSWITYKDFNETKRCTILTVESVADLDRAKTVVQERRTADEDRNAAGSG